MTTAAIRERSRELAEALGQVRRIGPDSWAFPANTDTGEAEHRVDRIGGRLYCSCRGFIHWRHCKHSDWIKEFEGMEEKHTALARVEVAPQLPSVHRSPQQLANRLAEMIEERGLVAAFFKDVMEEGHDYGVIPGTDKPTLFKPGAEKLAELYGYAPVVRDRQETVDYETGFYRVVITMGLVSKETGAMVAEGVGECNTREARYFYRWVAANRIPAGIDKASLKQERRRGRNGEFTVYRLENDDLFTLWNTVLKMAKKRALVDVVLSSTRSSGIFGRSAKEVQEWIEAEYTDITEFAEDEDPDTAPAPAQPAGEPAKEKAARLVTKAQQERITAISKDIRESQGDQYAAKVKDELIAAFPAFSTNTWTKNLTEEDAATVIALLEDRQAGGTVPRKEQAQAAALPL